MLSKNPQCLSDDENEDATFNNQISESDHFQFFNFRFLFAFIIFSLQFGIIYISFALIWPCYYLIVLKGFCFCNRGLLETFILFICAFSFTAYFMGFLFCSFDDQFINFELDLIYFWISQILVLSFLKSCYTIDSSLLSSIFDIKTFNMLNIFHQFIDENETYQFDFKNKNYSNDFKDYKQDFSLISVQYQNIQDTIIHKEPQKQNYNFNDFTNANLSQNIYQCMILNGLILLKTFFSFYYFTLNHSSFNTMLCVFMGFSVIVSNFMTINYIKLFGNKDLIRKYKFMVSQNDKIDFQQLNDENIKNKIDIICPITLETWDSARKFILSCQNSWINTLEISYICLFLYLAFISLVCLSSYFDFHWIFKKESFLNSPIIMITSTFNFLFLIAIFLVRVYEGTKFNNTFTDLDNSLSFLLDIIEDLETQFDSYFNRSKFDMFESKKKSIYKIIIKRIKQLSMYYINNSVEYQGIKYDKQQQSIIRIKLLRNSKLSLLKIHKSLKNDQNLHSYKFLNFLEINFNEALFAFVLGLLPGLPTIIPKFIGLYQSDQAS